MTAIKHCRTPALGGHVEVCTGCGHWRVAYNSCRNRHCPKCQGAAARAWLAEREADLFPLAPKTGAIPAVQAEVVSKLSARKERQAQRLSDAEIASRAARSGRQAVGTQAAIVKQHQRSLWVAEHAKRRAAGCCDLCRKPAPFNDRNGRPYLETHHVVWLARGGADTIENTAALCPNCHRRVHVLEVPSDIVRMMQSVAVGRVEY